MTIPAAFTFSDFSVLNLAEDHSLDEVLKVAFPNLDEETADLLVCGAVDYFWEFRRVPLKHGEEAEWPEPFATKAALAKEVLRGIMMRQLSVHLLGVSKFTLITVDPDTGKSEALKGQDAMDRANLISIERLFDYGTRGIGHRAFRALQENRLPDARAEFEAWSELDDESGEAWFWRALVTALLGDVETARPMFRKGAELLKSPYLDRVECPKCGWIPGVTRMWECDQCKETLDTFATRAKCPKCGKAWTETSCIACHASSPHRSWWLSLPTR